MDNNEKSYFDGYSKAELIVLAWRALSILNQSLRKLLPEHYPLQEGPCNNCDKRNSCSAICDKLEKHLDGAYSGSYILSKTYGDILQKVAFLQMERGFIRSAKTWRVQKC